MSCVYEISFKDCVDNYVGSCIDLDKRKKTHKNHFHNENSDSYNKKLYQFIRDNYDWESVIFEVLEQHDEILEHLELRKREQHFININNPTLNHNRAYRSEEQLKEYYKEEKKKYYQNNQAKLKEKSKKHCEENRDYYKEYSKKHYQENPEDYKKYREENKAKINKKCDCECGGKYTHINKSKHIKTKKHKKYLDNLEKIII